jgi:hypothetical protein
VPEPQAAGMSLMYGRAELYRIRSKLDAGKAGFSASM